MRISSTQPILPLSERLRRVATRVPIGAYHVDAKALREARQKTPKGEYHCG